MFILVNVHTRGKDFKMEQFGLAIFGLIAGWLSQDKREHYRKYAPVFGLLSQSFWITITFLSQQWGMFVLSLFYTMIWLKGVKTYWIK